MIIELKKNSMNRSSAYKELTERVIGEKMKVTAMSPALITQCKDLDGITRRGWFRGERTMRSIRSGDDNTLEMRTMPTKR